jgi:lysozyme
VPEAPHEPDREPEAEPEAPELAGGPAADVLPPAPAGSPQLGESAPAEPGPAEEPCFELAAPAEDGEALQAPASPEAAEEPPVPEGPPNGQLFPAPPANDAQAMAVEPETTPPSPDGSEPARPRVLIDDTAPFEFTPQIVQPIPSQPRGGLLSLAALAVIGLAFFGGGVFWAVNARGAAVGGLITPLAVGLLAGLAGVGLVSVAVFLLLQRLWRAERE